MYKNSAKNLGNVMLKYVLWVAAFGFLSVGRHRHECINKVNLSKKYNTGIITRFGIIDYKENTCR